MDVESIVHVNALPIFREYGFEFEVMADGGPKPPRTYFHFFKYIRRSCVEIWNECIERRDGQ
jgi:hypothetical protein